MIRSSSCGARAAIASASASAKSSGVAVVQRRQRLAGEIPLVEEEERRAAAPGGGRRRASVTSSSNVDVDASTSRPVDVATAPRRPRPARARPSVGQRVADAAPPARARRERTVLRRPRRARAADGDTCSAGDRSRPPATTSCCERAPSSSGSRPRGPSIDEPSRLMRRQRRQAAFHLGKVAGRVVAAPELARAEDVERERRASSGSPRPRAPRAPGSRGRSRRRGRRPGRSPSRSSSRSTAGSPRLLDDGVSTRTPGPSGGRKRVIVPGRRREVARRILGVDPDLDRVPAPRRAAGQRRAARRRRSAAARARGRCPVDSSVTGCSTWRRRSPR